jgi:hypothetical protein
MHWAGTISYATDAELLKSTDLPLSSTGDFTLSGLTITDNILNKTLLDSELNSLDKVVINGLNDIQLDSLTMNQLHAMHRDDEKHKDSIRFSNLTLKKITLHDLNNLSVDSLELKTPGLYMVKNKTSDWEYQQWIPAFKTPSTSQQEAESQSTKPADEPPFKFAINSINIDDADFCYLDKTTSLYYCYTHKSLAWSGPINYGGDLKTQPPVSLSGNFKLIQPLIVNKTLDRELINIEALKINDIDYSAEALAINSIDIKALKGEISKDKDGSWEFDKLLTESKDGTKNETNKKQKSPVTSNTDSQITTSAGKSPFKFAINGINIDDADFCYLDNKTSLHYCYAHKSLAWSGPINYGGDLKTQPPVSLSGNFKLIQPLIVNKAIDRELINIEAFNINKLIVTGQNARLANFDIDKLSALQRGKKDDDTVSFTALKINDVNYSADALAVNTIDLKGLKSEISKNKDGSWEFDKWLPESKDETKNKANKKQTPSESSKTDNEAAKQAFDIAINKINIDTNEPIAFTDNSTAPPLTVGLTTLSFSVAQLNSKKPDIASPIKLSAKTSRYATVDVEGTIQPLAKNISFDAKGKLRGIDLRAATPLTKKTIGHIIQSGQMDADLTLLSKDGQLDSNIALSLYHFNIKSISKKDSEKLDDALGIPLNQTLALLRDKDDSIHLDIPITGDIKNPDFDPMDAIVTATSKAAMTTLITFYTPYGLIYAGGDLALSLATALNFDPILFASGSSELVAGNKEKLDKLSKLLTEKPQVHLTLCGITNNDDTFALYPEIKKQYEASKKENKTPDIALTDEQSLALETLAGQRQINSKDYLVDQHKIAHERLILCAPEHSTDDDAISGVEINIK